MLLLSHVRLLSGKPKMVNMVNLCVFFFFLPQLEKTKQIQTWLSMLYVQQLNPKILK